MTLQWYLSCAVILGLPPLWFQLNNDNAFIISVKSTNNSTTAILNLSQKTRLFPMCIYISCAEHNHNNHVTNIGRTTKLLCLKSQDKF
jgi:hypothetical protein